MIFFKLNINIELEVKTQGNNSKLEEKIQTQGKNSTFGEQFQVFQCYKKSLL